ncbi:MAG: hypothetical protein IKS60_06840 [Lachnospiraceae bacterium]|nr:hypothetical protein [Lachnospiraceae bacterium]
MNVKTYLKGIGVGIIVTSLILIIAGNMNNRMSDADVIKRAKELGMVEASAVNQSNENIEETKVEETKETAEVSDAKENSAETSTTETTEDNKPVENNTTEDTSINTSEDVKPDEASIPEDNTTDTSESNVTDDTASETASGETVKVEVRSGMSSESVSLAVKNAGLVEDDNEFNKYLCENGYDKKLRVGSFDIPSGSDFETISKYLCGIK